MQLWFTLRKAKASKGGEPVVIFHMLGIGKVDVCPLFRSVHEILTLFFNYFNIIVNDPHELETHKQE